MALTLVATPGAANANSFCTVAEGDTYHEARLHSTDWTGASTAIKTAALVMATRLLDVMFVWEAWPTSATQALQWPRSSVLAWNQIAWVGSTEIPVQLKNATAEFARQLIAEDRTLDSDVEAQGITSLRAGSVALTFKDSVYAKPVPDSVTAFIPSWWGHLRGKSSGVRELVRA